MPSVKRSAEQVCIILATMLKRQNQKRARISIKTLTNLCGGRVRAAKIRELQTMLPDFGVALVELNRGGFAILEVEALSGAKSITLGIFDPNEIANPDYEKMYADLGIQADEEEAE